MDEVKAEALTTLKTLLGITGDTQDTILDIIIDEVINMIQGYCRIDEIPTKLESYIPIMAADYYRLKGYGKAAAPEFVKSESQGKRSYSVEVGFNVKSWFNNYKDRLNPFRNLHGRVPTDLDKAVTE
ncbi:MAG: phage head-tail connector protein [Clostridia bacterium]|nr:phage head-tail connector protein [Clostridia bacterium]